MPTHDAPHPLGEDATRALALMVRSACFVLRGFARKAADMLITATGDHSPKGC